MRHQTRCTPQPALTHDLRFLVQSRRQLVSRKLGTMLSTARHSPRSPGRHTGSLSARQSAHVPPHQLYSPGRGPALGSPASTHTTHLDSPPSPARRRRADHRSARTTTHAAVDQAASAHRRASLRPQSAKASRAARNSPTSSRRGGERRSGGRQARRDPLDVAHDPLLTGKPRQDPRSIMLRTASHHAL